AVFLSAAGESRQYALDHPGDHTDHDGAFPEWVADAAHRNPDSLAELIDHDPDLPDTTDRRWVSVVFLQGEDADRVLDIIDRDGTDAAIDHLTGYDFGEETTQAALENGYVYDTPPVGTLDRTATHGTYTLTYSPFLSHVSLLRAHHAAPDPEPGAVAAPAPASASVSAAGTSGRAQGRARRAEGKDWSARRPGASASQGRGLAL